MAYKHGDGKKIDGRRVIVDVERGRTVTGWLPRRLGGGLGGTRNRGDRERSVHGHSVSQDRDHGSTSRPLRDRSDADNRSRRHGSREDTNGSSRRERGDREDRHRDRGDRRDKDRESKRRGTRSRSGSRERVGRKDRVSARDRIGGASRREQW